MRPSLRMRHQDLQRTLLEPKNLPDTNTLVPQLPPRAECRIDMCYPHECRERTTASQTCWQSIPCVPESPSLPWWTFLYNRTLEATLHGSLWNAVVVSPTRELGMQIKEQIVALLRGLSPPQSFSCSLCCVRWGWQTVESWRLTCGYSLSVVQTIKIFSTIVVSRKGEADRKENKSLIEFRISKLKYPIFFRREVHINFSQYMNTFDYNRRQVFICSKNCCGNLLSL